MLAILYATLFALVAASPVPQEDVAPGEPDPSGPTAAAIHPNWNGDKCVDVQGGNLNPGTKVQIWDCNGTEAQKFVLSRGDHQIQVAPRNGTNLCLEVSGSGNGAGVQTALCNKSLNQNWYYTDDNRIAVTGKGLCLDLNNGDTTNGNALQVWECGDGNTNQVWTQ